MKKITLIKTAALAATASLSTIAAAQTVTFYGLLDVGVEYLQNVASTQTPAPGGTTTILSRVPTNSNTAPSRLGVKGSTDLGDGVSMVYTAEAGIDPGNGMANQGGRILGRQLYAGIGTPYGTVSIGRQYTMTFWSNLDADILGGGIYGTGSLDAYLPNARADNTAVWTHKLGGLTLGANYSFGRDGATATPTTPAATNCAGEGVDATACRQWSAMAKYNADSWGAAVAFDRLMGNGTNVTFGNLNGGMADTRTTLNGWGKFGSVKVGGGVIARSNDATVAAAQGSDSQLLHVGFTMPLTEKLSLAAQYAQLSYSKSDAYTAKLTAVRGTYTLGKGASIFAQLGNIDNGSASTVSVSSGAALSSTLPGGNQQGVNIGFNYAF